MGRGDENRALTQTYRDGRGDENRAFTQTYRDGRGDENRALTQTYRDGRGDENRASRRDIQAVPSLTSGYNSGSLIMLDISGLMRCW